MIAAKKIFLFFFLMGVKLSMYSQCAMCRAVVESDIASGGTKAKGINHGIIYLMMFPYVLIAIVGYFVYKHYKKNKQIEQV